MPAALKNADMFADAAMADARRAMIDSQLRVSGVNQDWLLAAFSAVAREDFVPAAARDHAYIDRAIALGASRALPAPLVQGLLLAEADPRPDDRALVIHNGSGYLAALLRQRTGSVDEVEGTGPEAFAGLNAGYSLVLIDGAIEVVPPSLGDLIAEGGSIVTGLLERGVTRIAVGRKLDGQIAILPVADIGIPVLQGFTARPEWTF